MAQAKSQSDYRRSIIAKDQFGRPWLLNIEIATGDPTGGIVPCGWTDHLRTPMKFIMVPKDEYNQPTWGRCLIDIAGWMAEIRNADIEWLRRLNEAGVMQYKNKFNPEMAKEDGYLLELAGPQPWPSLACLEALRTGMRSLLGYVDGVHVELDERAKQLMQFRNLPHEEDPIAKAQAEVEREMLKAVGLPDVEGATMADEPVMGTSQADYQQFLKQGKAAGMAYPAIIAAWQAHKEEVAAATS